MPQSIPQSMKAAVMVAGQTIEIQSRPVPAPAAGEVLIRPEYVGICGSDLHIYEADWGGRLTRPHVLGHECAGTVVALGTGVTSLTVGDRVSLEPGVPCRRCDLCRAGKYNLCPTVRFLGAPTLGPAQPQVDGALAEYLTHPAELCFRLPDSVSSLAGALVEPFAVGLHAARTAQAAPGQTGVVIGAGCIGLVSMLALRLHGVSRIIVLDVMPARLASARRLGADEALDSAAPGLAGRVLEATGGAGADIAVDTSGAGAPVGEAITFLRKGSPLVLVGYSRDGNLTFPLRAAINKEIRLLPIYRYRNVYSTAIGAVAAGQVDLAGIVSNIYPFEETARAFAENLANRNSVIKAVVEFA